MKYLAFLFLVCALALTAQVQWGAPVKNPFSDGRLACLPMPPAVRAAELGLLPPPRLDNVSRPVMPVQIQAAKIEIFDPKAGNERLAETRQADQFDWGIPRDFLHGPAMTLASIVKPRVVEPVPVNTSVPTPYSDFVTSAPPLIAGAEAASAPELQPIPLVTASLNPAGLTGASEPVVPNLYLPEGAVNEEGAGLTLINPELNAYENPNVQSTKASFLLKSGDRVRPLTRLRNENDYDWIKIEQQGDSWWVQAEYFIRVDPRNKLTDQSRSLAVGDEQVDKDSALAPDYHPDDLTDVAAEYTFGKKDIRLRKETAEAFARMAEEAKRQKLKLRVFSGFRDFSHQKKLYLEAVQKHGPKQNGTAAPGYSEHQLGTTVDVSSDDRRTILSGRFGDTPEGRWLHDNSERFGFRKSYTNENTEEVGYKPEPWHLRYIGLPKAAIIGIARN